MKSPTTSDHSSDLNGSILKSTKGTSKYGRFEGQQSNNKNDFVRHLVSKREHGNSSTETLPWDQARRDYEIYIQNQKDTSYGGVQNNSLCQIDRRER